MNGFGKIFPSYATFFAKMAERKVVPFDEFYYQLKLTHLFQKPPVFCHKKKIVKISSVLRSRFIFSAAFS
jgi:hypothetical protein